MRILEVCPYSSGGCGVWARVREEAIRLAALGNEVKVLSSNFIKGGRETDKEFDVSVVSDMIINNLNDFIKTVLEIPKVHRIHLFYTNDHDDGMTYVNKLRNEFKNQENVAIIPLLEQKDIEKIIMGELKKSVIPIYKGTVHDLKLIGHPPQMTTQDIPKRLCENPINLGWGFYQIWYGSQLIVGEGYGNTIYCRNINFLPLAKEVK